MDYKSKIIQVLAEAANYCAAYNLRVVFMEAPKEQVELFENGEFEDKKDFKEVEVTLNIDNLLAMIEGSNDEVALHCIYSVVYTNVAKLLCKLFENCKQIKKLSKDEGEFFLFAYSFVQGDDTLNTNSNLRAELELTNSLWLKYNNEKETFPRA